MPCTYDFLSVKMVIISDTFPLLAGFIKSLRQPNLFLFEYKVSLQRWYDHPKQYDKTMCVFVASVDFPHPIITESVEEKPNSQILMGIKIHGGCRLQKGLRFLLPIKSAKGSCEFPKRISCWKVKVDQRGSPETKKGCTKHIKTSWLRMASWRFKLASYKAICYIRKLCLPFILQEVVNFPVVEGGQCIGKLVGI